MYRKTTSRIIAVMALGLLFLLAFHREAMFHPNEHLFADWGDGIKNYYSYAYHIKQDTSFVHFQGMNYPHGELHQFSDGQPVLANAVKALSVWMPGIENYSIGILNLLLLFSFIIGAIFLMLILRNFEFPVLYSIYAAVFIMGLSPQVFRLTGHLSLAYFFSFPVIWYLLILDKRFGSMKYAVTMGIINLVILFIHPYLALINMAFTLMYYIFANWSKFSRWIGYALMRLTLNSVMPIIIWKIYLLIYDHHEQRAEDVFFLTGNTATFQSLVLPPYGWLNQQLNHVFKLELPWEGWAYLGAVMAVLFIILLVYIPIQLIARRKWPRSLVELPASARVSLAASVPVLLFSLGFPYRLGMDFILDWFPALQQIRALGRFAWVFFYVFNVTGLLVIWRWMNYHGWRKNIIMATLLLLLFVEASFYHFRIDRELTRTANLFDLEQLMATDHDLASLIVKTEPDTYQALITIPFYHIGSPVYSYEPGETNVMTTSVLLSYHTGLPLVCSALSRTSEKEARENINLLGYPWYPKSFFGESPTPSKLKPFLVLVEKEAKWSEEENWWVARADTLFDLAKYLILSLDESMLTDRFSLPQPPGLGWDELEPGRFYHFGPAYEFLCVDSIDLAKPGRPDIQDARQGRMNDYNMLYDGYEYWFKPNEIYNISFLYNNDTRLAHSNTFVLAEIKEDGKEHWSRVENMRQTHTIGDTWSRMSFDFNVEPDTRRIKIFLKSWSKNNEKIYFQDILIRNKHTHVFGRSMDGVIFYDNHRIDAVTGWSVWQ